MTQKGKLDLSKYTKDELIELVKAIAYHANPLVADETIRYCLIDIDHRRNIRLIDEAYEHAQAASEARERYIELVNPYQGKPLSAIPAQTLEEMRKCIEKAEREERIYLLLSEKIEKRRR